MNTKFDATCAAAAKTIADFAGENVVIGGKPVRGTEFSQEAALLLEPGGPREDADLTLSVSRAYLPEAPPVQEGVEARDQVWRVSRVRPRPGTWLIMLVQGDT